MDFKIGDRVYIIKALHPDVEPFVGNYYYIESINTSGIGGIPCKIQLKGVHPWVLSEELAPLSVYYSELAKVLFPDGHREGDKWILR